MQTSPPAFAYFFTRRAKYFPRQRDSQSPSPLKRLLVPACAPRRRWGTRFAVAPISGRTWLHLLRPLNLVLSGGITMGEHDIDLKHDERKLRAYMKALLGDLRALEYML